MTKTEKYQAAQKKLAEAKAECQVVCKEVLKEQIDGLFDKWGDKLESIGWVQYTPYFNDGDTCEFSVHTEYPYINGECLDEIQRR